MNTFRRHVATAFTNFALILAVASLAIILQSNVTAQTTSDLYHITGGVTRSQMDFRQITVPKGGEQSLADFKGPGKVTYFYITDDTVGRWYPGLVLKVFWDDETDPGIQVPLADFFGAMGSRAVDYQSAPMQINHACFMSYLPMPCSKRARFVLANDGDRDYSQKVAYGVDFEAGAAYASETSRLHCEWRRSNPVTNGLHTIMETSVRGNMSDVFCKWFPSLTMSGSARATPFFTWTVKPSATRPAPKTNLGLVGKIRIGESFPRLTAAMFLMKMVSIGCIGGMWPTQCGFNSL